MKLAKAVIPLAALGLLAGCNDPHMSELGGIWDLEMRILEPETEPRPEWQYRGFLQIYATGDKFKMRAESIAQIVEMEGTWTMSEDGKTLTLDFKDIKFDDRGGELRRPPGMKPLDPQTVREAYSGKMPLKFDSEAQTLTGLEMDLGPLVVQHAFKKGRG